MASPSLLLIVPAALCAALGLAWRAGMDLPPQDGAKPSHVVRIRLQEADAGPVLQFLSACCQDPSALGLPVGPVQSQQFEERIRDEWFDDGAMNLLQQDAEVRHQRRIGPGPEPWIEDTLLLRNKGRSERLEDTIDAAAVTRLEGAVPLAALLAPGNAATVFGHAAALDLPPASLERALSLDRKRFGFRLGSKDAANGAFLLVAVDQCTSLQPDLILRWHEAVLSLDPQGEGDAADPAWRAIQEQLQAALLSRFPRSAIDARSEYARTYLQLQANTWLPLRWLLGMRVSSLVAKVALLLLAAATMMLAAIALRRRDRARAAMAF